MELQILEERKVLGKGFVIYGDINDPLFLAKDVADWIEYDGRTGQMLESVDDDEKLMNKIYASGQKRNMWFLTEDGLYEVLMQSKKPIAKAFKKEVKHILKNIRREGGHLTPQKIEEVLMNPDVIIELAQKLKASREEYLVLEQQIAEYQPKINYLDTIISSNNAVTISQISADYGISAIEMNRILSELKVQRKVSGQWILFRKHMNQGYTKSETRRIPVPGRADKVVMNTKWTQKGRLFLYELLKTNGYYPQIDLNEFDYEEENLCSN